MTSSYLGMDPDEVNALGGRLHNEAANLQGLMQKLDSLASNMQANWDGADAVRFNQEYTGTYRGQINTAIEQLGHLADAAIRNANEQRATSS